MIKPHLAWSLLALSLLLLPTLASAQSNTPAQSSATAPTAAPVRAVVTDTERPPARAPLASVQAPGPGSNGDLVYQLVPAPAASWRRDLGGALMAVGGTALGVALVSGAASIAVHTTATVVLALDGGHTSGDSGGGGVDPLVVVGGAGLATLITGAVLSALSDDGNPRAAPRVSFGAAPMRAGGEVFVGVRF